MVGISIKKRYEVRAVLGQGGMGVVYHAYDTLMRRDVALKTLRDVPSNVFLELFSRECSVLAGMVHPNVVEVFDMGEFEEDGIAKPYFVMPLLPGSTLHDLIYPNAIPLSATRCVDIISQACRGLQAAHERDLLHRDIKPRNIFVMRDDAVKVIDFGVAHLIGGHSTGIRGTPQYMSPEQINFKQLDNRSDIFSLAVVCYEALTASHPFLRRADRRDSDTDIVEAITSYIPPLASDLNPSVSRPVAQAVAKAMAKDVWNRFETASAFAEALQKGLRNENSEASSFVVRTRLERARRCFEQNDLQFASEIVSQLEAEGHSGAEISEFRRELDEAVLRARTDRLIIAANRCFEDEEYTLALRKIQEILEIDAANIAALNLKKRIQNLLTEQKIAELLKIAAEHLERSAFTNARQAVQDALKLRPSDTRARQFLTEVDSRQKEVLRQRQDQERLYQSAQAAFFAGKIELAIENLEQLERLTAQSSDIRDRADDYKELYRRVRAERDALKAALAQANNLLDHDLAAAQKICDRYLAKYSDQPDFLALSREITKRLEDAAEIFRKTVASRVESEDSLDARLRILEDALKTYPKDEYFLAEIQNVKEKARTVAAIADKARALERQGDFLGAIGEWDNLRSAYWRFPGLSDEIARARAAYKKQRAELKTDLLKKIERALQSSAQDVAGKLLEEAEREFPSDAEVGALRLRREKQLERIAKVNSLIERARTATRENQFQETAKAIAEAGEVSGEISSLKTGVFQASLEQAELVANSDWRTAKTILEVAAKLDTELSVPARFWEDVLRRERDEDVQNALKIADSADTTDDLLQARTILQKGLGKHVKEPRLQARLVLLDKAILERRRKEERERDLLSLRALRDELRQTEVPNGVRTFVIRSKAIADRYGKDREFTAIVLDINKHVDALETASAALSRDDTETAFRICNEFLARDPDHRPFLNLKAQAETLERDKATEFLEQVAHHLADEPDLSKKRTILEDALQRYPNEQYFADELALVRNEQQIIRTITDRAQSLEAEGFPAEALEQWAALKALYPSYPGVDSAIEHCKEVIRAKRAEARARLRAAVGQAIQNRDYEAAREWLSRMQAEFPNDPELPALRELIDKRTEHRAHVLGILKQSEANFLSGQFQAGHESIMQALSAAGDEVDIPGMVAAILVRHTGQALQTDLGRAELMIADAKTADPAVRIPAELQTSLRSARRQQDLDELRSNARSLEAAGNFSEALAAAYLFLEKYPGEPEALAIRDGLLDAKKKAESVLRREQQLTELRSFEDRARTISQPDGLRELLERTRLIARQNKDSEVARMAERVSRVIAATAEIQDLMNAGRLDEAEALCARSASEFPESSAFENLQAEIELRRLDQAADYLRDVERRLAAEPDYGKQEEILKEAVRLYPAESYYADELTLVHNKQTMLNSELGRARDLESKELYEDALREWEGLRHRYPWYAGIDKEVERVRQEWESRTTAVRKNWVGRVNQALATGDVNMAASILEQATVDLDGDPVLNDLRAQIDDVRQAQTRRGELVAQGGEALRDGRLAEGIELLKTAVGISRNDVAFRDWVLDLLLRKARSSLEHDWHDSELLVGGVGQIDPNYPIPADLSQAIRGKKRESEIAEILEKVARAESSGDLTGAKRLLEIGQARFPDETRIKERHRNIADQLRQREIQQLREQAQQETLAFKSQLQALGSKRQIAKLKSSYIAKNLTESSDPVIRALAVGMVAEIDAKVQAFDVKVVKEVKAKEVKAVKVVQQSSEVKVVEQSSHRRAWYLSIPVVVLLGALAFWFLGRTTKPTETTNTPVVTPSTSEVQIAGNVDTGNVDLDGRDEGALNSGSKTLSGITPGSHVLRITSSEGEASVAFFENSLGGPRVGTITANGIAAVAVAAKGQNITLSSSVLTSQPVLLDRQPAGSTVKGVLALPPLQPGTHHLQIGQGNDALNFDIPVSQDSGLYLQMAGAAPTGTLDVKTNIPGTDLFLNGTKYSTAPETTSRLVLPAKGYDIYAARDGYVNSESAHVEVAKGSRAVVTLRLNPKPAVFKTASGAPGTRIKVDGRDLGDLSKGKTQTITAGMHTFEISRQGFQSKRFQRAVEPGGALTLTGADLDLSPGAEARELEDWNRVKASSNLADLQTFQQRYPSGPHVQAVNDAIQQLEWKGIDRNNAAALNAYLAKHPDGSHSSEARRLLEQLAALAKSRMEQSEWDSLDKNKEDALRAFITKYPNGNNAAAAQRRLTDLINQDKAAAQQNADDNAWKSANVSDRASIERYLGQFPSGRHTTQAQQALANLTRKPPPQQLPPPQPPQVDGASVLPVLQEFAAAWSNKDVDTIVRLQPSQNRKALKSQFAAVKVWRMTLTPLGAPEVSNDHVSVTYHREVYQVFSNGGAAKTVPSTVIFELQKQGSSWVIVNAITQTQ